jgi:hypothetical protein
MTRRKTTRRLSARTAARVTASIRRSLREMAAHVDPIEEAFLMAQQIATKSTAARLSAAALDLTEQHYIEGVERTADVLRRIYTQRGTDYGDETTLHEEGGYLYGLAVGLSIGRGGTR